MTTLESSSIHHPLQQAFFFFEQARLCNQENPDTTTLQAMQHRYQSIRQSFQHFGESLCRKLSDIRSDLQIYVSSAHTTKLPESLFLSLTRNHQEPTEDAQLYLLLHEEGAEIGFGFGLRGKRRTVGKIEQRFFETLQRFHRKAERYLYALLRHTYRLWPTPQQSSHTPSLSLAEWQKTGGVVVRLLNREVFLRDLSGAEGLVSQAFGELIGLYGFLDRIYTNIPYIRPLGHGLLDEQDATFADDDIASQQVALRDLALEFVHYAAQEGFALPLEMARSYILSLQTKPFVILSGVAGTGKSQLAQLFARFLTEDAEALDGNPHIALLPVRPDWLDPQALLGYEDRLTHTYYVTPFLRMLLRAQHDRENPYFVILDELNLARTEYYLSDILSLLESRRYREDGQLLEQTPLFLHNQPDPYPIEDAHMGLLSIPGTLPLPQNLYLIGTLNLDETTHRLSPKVLDRAQMIELEPTTPSLFLQWITQRRPAPLTRSPSWIASLRAAFTRESRYSAPIPPSQWQMPPELLAQLAGMLDTLFALFGRAGFGFGLRTVQEGLLFAEHTCRMVGTDHVRLAWIVERILLQKFLPRLHGPRYPLEDLLARLLLLCWEHWTAPAALEHLLHQELEPDILTQHQTHALQHEPLRNPTIPAPNMPVAARKIARMLRKLQQDAYVDFHA